MQDVTEIATFSRTTKFTIFPKNLTECVRQVSCWNFHQPRLRRS